MTQYLNLNLGCLICAGILATLSLSGCDSEVARDLSDEASLRVLADLAEGEISASRHLDGKGKEGRWSIIVEKEFRQGALLILSRVKAFEFQDTSESPNDSFLGDSEGNRDYRDRKMALALEKSLERLPRVREVRVHLALKHTRPNVSLNSSSAIKEDESAAVLVTTYPDAEVDPERISQLIGGATGIPQQSIAVIVNKLPEEIFSSQAPKGASPSEVPDAKDNIKEDGDIKLGFPMIVGSIMAMVILLLYSRSRFIRPIKLIIDEKC